MTTPMLDYNLPFRPFMKMLNDIDRDIHDRRSNREAQPGYYRYIPIETDKLIRLFASYEFNDYLHRRHSDDIFLDVGCGSGRVLAMARYMLDMQVKGVEIISPIARAGRKAYGVDIAIGNAFDILTEEFMAPVACVYTYMPIQNHPLMLQLHLHIMKVAREGTERVEMLPVYIGVSTGISISRIRRMW